MSANTKIIIGLVALALILLLNWWFKEDESGESAGDSSDSDAAPPDEESMDCLRTNAHQLVWAGFHDRAEIIEMLPDVSTAEVSASILAPLVDAEIVRKGEAERGWPGETDCDRLDAAFEELHTQGVFAQQYVGYTQSDGFQDVSEALAGEDEGKYTGFCFFTAQDVDHLLEGERSLFLAFGDSEVGERAVEVGHKICSVMRGAGFETQWDETPDTRIELKNIDWKRRGLKDAHARLAIRSHQCASR